MPPRKSHPSRVRGLKFSASRRVLASQGVAPFTGAWIEIRGAGYEQETRIVAPFTGAWIEIPWADRMPWVEPVAPFTGAWIEIFSCVQASFGGLSHPSRVRGLKFRDGIRPIGLQSRTLHGCVD